jgi:hypothetical protein
MSAVMGTRWYPLTRPLARSYMFGRGYLSEVVTVLMRRLSWQGRQEPSLLGNLCRGDAHAEFDLLMINAFLSFLNSVWAILSCLVPVAEVRRTRGDG